MHSSGAASADSSEILYGIARALARQAADEDDAAEAAQEFDPAPQSPRVANAEV